jgi:hypothetical protein
MELPSKHDFDQFMTERQARMTALVGRLQDPALLHALATGGSQVNLNAIKQEITTLNTGVSDYNKQIEHVLHTVEREHATLAHNVKRVKERTKHTLHHLNKSKELAELRKEQANELKAKYGATIHTSYLGLWRPLHPETHAILYTLAILFTLTSVAAVVFLIRTPLPAWTGAAQTQAPVATSLFDGGARLYRKK